MASQRAKLLHYWLNCWVSSTPCQPVLCLDFLRSKRLLLQIAEAILLKTPLQQLNFLDAELWWWWIVNLSGNLKIYDFIHLLVFMVSTIQLFNKMIIQSVAGISHPTWLLGVFDSPGECVFEYGFWCWIALMLKVYQQVLQEVLWKSHSRSVVMPQVLEHQCFTRRIFWILNSETWVGCHLVLSDKHLFPGVTWWFIHICPCEFIMHFQYLISAVQILYVQNDVQDQLRKIWHTHACA